MTQAASIVVVAAVGYSPLHLLWLQPLSYLTGFLALRSRVFGLGESVELPAVLHSGKVRIFKNADFATKKECKRNLR
jgi:hypothetical protein